MGAGISRPKVSLAALRCHRLAHLPFTFVLNNTIITSSLDLIPGYRHP